MSPITLDEMNAVNRFLEQMDYYTLPQIRRAFSITGQPVTSEYDGNLLSGQLVPGGLTDYYKRVDDTGYFKHFLHRPMM